MRNRVRRSSCRTEVKKLRQAIDTGNQERIQALMPEVMSILDKTAKVGAIHRNAAARTKSRLTRAAGRALGEASSTTSA